MDSELEQLGERIAEQAAHLDAAMHRLLSDLRTFDERGGWYAQGALSCAHWLAWRVGWSLVTARDHLRVARKLAELPAIDDALRRGEISYSKVRAMTRVATPENEALLLEYAKLTTGSGLDNLCRKYAIVQQHGKDPHPLGDQQRRYVRRRDTDDGMVKIEAVLHPEEAEMVWRMLDHAATQLARTPGAPARDDSAESCDEVRATAGDSAESCDEVRAAAGDSAELPATAPATSPATVVAQPGGAGSVGAPQLCEAADGEASATSFLEQLLDEADALSQDDSAESSAVEISGETMPAGAISGLQQRAEVTGCAFNRADALVSLAKGYLRGDRPNRSPIELTITIPADSVRGGTGDPVDVGEAGESMLSIEAVRRLGCDAGVVEIIEDDHGSPISVGRKRRTIAGALKRALLERDTMCTFPGCTHRIFLEGHHIKHWADGGETSLSNTLLLCSNHHRFVHEYGYMIELGDDQKPRFRDRHGRLVPAVPERPVVAGIGWPHIRAMNESLAIDADTLACEWDGTRVDYGALVGHLVVADGLQ